MYYVLTRLAYFTRLLNIYIYLYYWQYCHSIVINKNKSQKIDKNYILRFMIKYYYVPTIIVRVQGWILDTTCYGS